MLGNGPQVLGNGNGPLVLGNGPHLLGNMSHSALCRIQHYVAFSIMSHSALCRIRGYVVVARQGGKIKYGDGKREKQLSRKKVYIRKIRKIDKYKR